MKALLYRLPLPVLSLIVLLIYAFQSPNQPQPSVADTPEAYLQEALSFDLNNETNGRLFFDAVSKAQEAYMRQGKEREALLLYAPKAHFYGLKREFDDDYMRVQDSVCALLAAKSKAGNDMELLAVCYFILWDGHRSDGNQDSALFYQKQLETLGARHDSLKLYSRISSFTQDPEAIWEALQQSNSPRWLYKKFMRNSCPVALAYSEKGEEYLSKKEYEKALEYQQKAIAHCKDSAQASHFHHQISRIYNAQSDAYLKGYDYEKALEYEKKAVEVSIYRKDSLWASTYYHKIAQIYHTKGDHEKLREYYQKALSYVQSDYPHAFRDYNHHIAYSYMEQGNYEKALRYLYLSLEYGKQDSMLITEGMDKGGTLGHNRRGFGQTHTNLALIYTDLKNFKKAQEHLLLVNHYTNNIQQNDNRWVYLISRHQYAQGYWHQAQGQYEQALEQYRQVLARSPKYIDALRQIARLEMERGRPAEAAQGFQHILGLKIKNFTPKSVLDNPRIEDIADKHGTLTFLVGKMTALRACLASDTPLDSEAYRRSIRELAERGVLLLEQVCNSFEREGSVAHLLETSYRLFEAAIEINWELYQSQGDERYARAAFELAERSKSVLLMGSLRENNALQFAGLPDSLVEQEHLFSQNIAFYEQQLHQARNQAQTEQMRLFEGYLLDARMGLDALKKRLEQDYPSYYQLKYSQRYASAEEVRARLSGGDLFVECFEGKQAVYVFAIDSAQGLRLLRRPTDNGYARNMEALLQTLTRFDLLKEQPQLSLDKYKALAHWFFAEYLQPFWEARHRHLVVVPDGEFGYLPFEALLTESAAGGDDFKQLPYLLRQSSVLYQYSATLWAKPSATGERASKGLLAMAAHYPPQIRDSVPVATRQGHLRKTLAPIDGARREVEQLQARWQGTFLYESQANEAQFKALAPDYDMLHLAMHGLVDAKQPELSSLAFTDSKDKTEDDFLQTFEIKRLPLRARLVVLSACETGYGKYAHGEGVVSIGRSFMYAGARSLLMSLWAVNDASTAYIIEKFYEELAQNNNKSQALRQAKLSYLEQVRGISAHPAYWLPFVVVGEDEPLPPDSRNNTTFWVLLAVLGFSAGAAFWAVRKRGGSLAR